MKKNMSGFTLLEIMIVIIVIGILITLTTVNYSRLQPKARDDRRQIDIANITKALELYYNDNGKYPTVTGTNSSINQYWYTSDTTSWNDFKTVMSEYIDDLNVDPKNNTGSVLSSAPVYNYAYFGGGYCGSASGQMYILVWRYEITNKTKFEDGTCTTNPLGDVYYANGASYHRVAK